MINKAESRGNIHVLKYEQAAQRARLTSSLYILTAVNSNAKLFPYGLPNKSGRRNYKSWETHRDDQPQG
jgi:hypothetical protein